jgi:hypothetical protein
VPDSSLAGLRWERRFGIWSNELRAPTLRRLYERQGFAHDGVRRIQEVGGRELGKTRQQRPANR